MLVGGWAAVAAGIAWLWLQAWREVPSPVAESGQGEGDRAMSASPHPLPLSQRERGRRCPPLRSLWPGILGGLLLALPGMIPSLMLDWGVDRADGHAGPRNLCLPAAAASPDPERNPPRFILRLGLLWGFWLLLGWWGRRAGLPGRADRECLLRLAGVCRGGGDRHLGGSGDQRRWSLFDRGLAADLLRYYWFRLTDVALPLGVALEGVALLALWCRRPACDGAGRDARRPSP